MRVVSLEVEKFCCGVDSGKSISVLVWPIVWT